MKKLDDRITAVPKWDKTAKDVWNERFANLTDEEEDEANSHSAPILPHRGRRKFYFLSAAAAILLLVVGTAFLYTKDITAKDNNICSAQLPDGSLAMLMPGTTISYLPILWLIHRQVDLNGEAYFTGNHAKGFSVHTPLGLVEVLGTSFNARTYDQKLIVSCIEGRVKVKANNSSVILTKNMEATLNKGLLSSNHLLDAESAIGWTKGIFSYYDKPLIEVLKDVERYYHVKIEAPAGIDTLRYSGKFASKRTADEALTIIGQPYNINFRIIR